MWQFFIFMELETFFVYFVIAKTLNMSHEKYTLAQLDEYSSIKIKVSLGYRYTYPTIREKNIVAFLDIYGARAIFLLFWDHKDPESESCEI